MIVMTWVAASPFTHRRAERLCLPLPHGPLGLSTPGAAPASAKVARLRRPGQEAFQGTGRVPWQRARALRAEPGLVAGRPSRQFVRRDNTRDGHYWFRFGGVKSSLKPWSRGAAACSSARLARDSFKTSETSAHCAEGDFTPVMV